MDNNRARKMSKAVGAADRAKSFESNFADEVRQLVNVRKNVFEVADAAMRQGRSVEDQNIDEVFLTASMANLALTLDAVDPADRLLREVFAFCALEPLNPWHWRILLEATIEVAFKKSGAHEKWNDGAFFELMMDVQELKRLDPSAKTHQRIAELLKKREPFKSKYTMKIGYLRKLVGKAEDPRYNPMIGYVENENVLELLTKRRQEKSGVTAEMASSLMEKSVETLIEATFADFRKRCEKQGETWSETTRAAVLSNISKMVRANLTGKDIE